MRELWVQSEIFQVLRLGFRKTGRKNYGVRLEGSHAQGRADVMIVDQGLNQRYIIEIKRATERDTLDELPRQLEAARNSLPITRAFAFIFAESEEDLPDNNRKLEKVINRLYDEDLIDSEEDLFIKGPDSIVRY